MTPDVETLFLSSMITRMAILIIFVVIRLSQKEGDHLYYWIWALLASTLGLMVSIRYSSMQVLSIPATAVMYFLFISSLAASWSGLRVFYSRSASISTMLIGSLLPSLIYALATFLGVPQWLMMPFIYFAASAFAGFVLYEVICSPEKKLFSQYVVAVAFSGYLLALLIPALLILASKMTASLQKGAEIPMLVDQAASILVYFGFIAMASENTNLILEKQARTDALTGLLNRRGAQKLLDRMVRRVRSGFPGCVLIADIDHFKIINDGLGHEAGDTVLKILSAVLMSSMRKTDNVVRWGGEEFLVILPNTTASEAFEFADRLRLHIEALRFHLNSESVLTVTLSIGIAEVNRTDENINLAIMRADQALYFAKENGRNRVCSAPQ